MSLLHFYLIVVILINVYHLLNKAIIWDFHDWYAQELLYISHANEIKQ